MGSDGPFYLGLVGYSLLAVEKGAGRRDLVSNIRGSHRGSGQIDVGSRQGSFYFPYDFNFDLAVA